MRRFAIVLGTAAVTLVAAAGPAWAHVKVEPESAAKGSDAVLSFVVPNEKEGPTTTTVVVTFPTDHPIAEALVEPLAGWKATVTNFHVTKAIVTDDGSVNTAVKSVTWTATDGKGILEGDFAEFKVSVGLPDDADSLAFPTTQTYSDGTSVAWNQVTLPNAPEPDNPQPVLTLTAGEGDTTATTAPATGSSAPATSTVKKSDVDNAKTFGIVGIVLGALGIVAGGAGLATRRKKAA